MSNKIIEKTWDHGKYEEELYKSWEKKGYFKPEINMVSSRQSAVSSKTTKDDCKPKTENRKPFVISMPPPNVTGKLHMGHALFATLEDIMTRYHRLLGEPTLWLPGTDHAGIATQTVVDKALKKRGIDKRELGREQFVERVWQWKKQYGGIITEQLRRLGSSCDWSRERFTLDEGLNLAVRKAFVDLYDKGLIYRGYYIVNWCPKCHTAIADDEVEHVEQKAKLYYFKYDKEFPITIASTRPETKLGDVAVAVHPDDSRYKSYIGKSYEVNIDDTKRTIKIIADKAVDKTFGTGALGVTPAHSFVDWQMAEQQGLEKIKVIDENGRMTKEAGAKYAGLKVGEARDKLIEYLRASSLMEKEQDYVNNLSVCYRCGGAIEPLPSLQWFVKMKPLSEQAKKVVEDGQITIIPKRFEKVYYHWMDNIRDWCISRQLWWGHQIPVWYKPIAKITDLDEIIKNGKEIKAGEAGSPVHEKKVPEYRLVVKQEDWKWIEKNIKFIEGYRYTDFFDGQHRTRVEDSAYTITEKKTAQVGVVAKIGKSGLFEDRKACLEERATAGYARYEIEFKGTLPEHFKDRTIIESTDILKQANNDFEGISVFCDMMAPNSEDWKQDEDVLDTWFSSALWPFSTLGWPEKTKDSEYFYPTTVMETGYDILFFWVARMIMFGLEFTGQVPFETVYLHGLVRDEQNRKMSKSLGNVLDPLDLIPKYGTDALRMALVVGSAPGQDLPVGEGKIKGYRNFANKVWNASRYVMLRVTDGDLKTGEIGELRIANYELDEKLFTEADKNILNEHEKVKKEVTRLINDFKFSLAGEKLFDYFWHTFADVYIEASKEQLANYELRITEEEPIRNLKSVTEQSSRTAENTKKILVKILSETLVMLHPFMPFVTEEVWQSLRELSPGLAESIMIAKWPN